jgi:hypothetical protein
MANLLLVQTISNHKFRERTPTAGGHFCDTYSCASECLFLFFFSG